MPELLLAHWNWDWRGSSEVLLEYKLSLVFKRKAKHE
jgi:hypothetical protein